MTALQDCLAEKRQKAHERLSNMTLAQDIHVPGVVVGAVRADTRQADAVLDDLARSRGWEPGGVK